MPFKEQGQKGIGDSKGCFVSMKKITDANNPELFSLFKQVEKWEI